MNDDPALGRSPACQRPGDAGWGAIQVSKQASKHKSLLDYRGLGKGIQTSGGDCWVGVPDSRGREGGVERRPLPNASEHRAQRPAEEAVARAGNMPHAVGRLVHRRGGRFRLIIKGNSSVIH